MISSDTISNLNNSNSFKEFCDYILENLKELDSIKGLSELSNTEAGETAKARAIAINMLLEILTPVLNHKEKRDPTVEEIQVKKDQYGL